MGENETKLGKLLIANRGEIAIRVARTAMEMGIATVAIHFEDDRRSLHTRASDEAVSLTGSGPAAYLDATQIIACAKQTGCDAIHPGYCFLSENASFARHCLDAGLTFVGPTPATLDLFGDKTVARRFAESCAVPVMAGTSSPTTLAQAQSFLASLGVSGGVMVKSVGGGGGGGRGMRPVIDPGQLPTAFERCAAEALQAFGNADLYVEQLFHHARNVEVQIVGDGTGAAIHLWEEVTTVEGGAMLESSP